MFRRIRRKRLDVCCRYLLAYPHIHLQLAHLKRQIVDDIAEAGQERIKGQGSHDYPELGFFLHQGNLVAPFGQDSRCLHTGHAAADDEYLLGRICLY